MEPRLGYPQMSSGNVTRCADVSFFKRRRSSCYLKTAFWNGDIYLVINTFCFLLSQSAADIISFPAVCSKPSRVVVCASAWSKNSFPWALTSSPRLALLSGSSKCIKSCVTLPADRREARLCLTSSQSFYRWDLSSLLVKTQIWLLHVINTFCF